MKLAWYVALLFFLTFLPACAHETQIGAALICDTQKQVERFVQLFETDLAAALTTVNSEENNPTACAITDIVYVQGRELEMARSAAHTFKIIPIIVIGENSPTGYRSVEPVSSLMLVEIRELAI
jgi:hypothetical protein